MSGLWPEPHVEALKLHHSRGLSFARIAGEINGEFGTTYTRNSAIGKAARLGLVVASPRPRNVKMPRASRKPPVRKERQRYSPLSKRIMTIIEGEPYIELSTPDIDARALHIDIQGLTGKTCKFPYGDGPFTFCGCPVITGLSWCAPHYRKTHHQPPKLSVEERERRKAHGHRVLHQSSAIMDRSSVTFAVA